MNAEGARHIRRYLDAFFNAMTNDAAFYLPVVVRTGTRLRADADRTREACPQGGSARVGTPVEPALSREHAMSQAFVLDALWRWTGPRQCDAILKGPVWVDSSAVSADYP